MESSKNNIQEEDQIDIIALLSKIWSGKKIILKTIVVFGVFGLLVALFTPNQYTASSMFTPNSGGKKKRIDYVNVLHANGQSKKVNWFKNPKIFPGSVINVVEKPEKVNDGKNTFMDDFVRIFGILSGALTTIVLVTKL